MNVNLDFQEEKKMVILQPWLNWNPDYVPESSLIDEKK